jgi:hypothetical protein
MFYPLMVGLLTAFVSCFFLSCPSSDKDEPEMFVYSSKEETGFSIAAELMGMVHAGYHDRDGRGNSGRLEDEYSLLDDMGVVWMLRDFSWDSIEPSDDNWRWDTFDRYVQDANAHDKKIMGLLAYETEWIHGAFNDETGKYACGHTSDRLVAGEREVGVFCEYVTKTVSRYDGEHGYGKVDAWCIWNEPNLQPRFWTGTPEEFFILTTAATAAIRQADPDAVIIGGALNTLADDEVWTKGMFKSGAMNNVDFFAYHPYLTDAVTVANRYNNFRKVVADYGFKDKIWITEIGYPILGSYGTEVPEPEMPEMVTKTITLLAVGGAQRIFWYELFDHGAAGDPKDSEAWFGLVDFDTFRKKGGADAYKLCAMNIPGKAWRSQYPMRSAKLPDFINAYYFEGDNGTHTLIIWNEVVVIPQAVQVTLPGSGQKVWDLASGGFTPIGEHSTYTLREGVNESIQFFTWENSDPSKPPRIAVP